MAYCHQRAKYICGKGYVASVMVFILDYFGTLDLEVKYIWRSKGVPSRILFILNRYLSVVYLAINVYCLLQTGSISFTVLIWIGSMNMLPSQDVNPLFPGCLQEMKGKPLFDIVFILINETTTICASLLVIELTGEISNSSFQNPNNL
ncbi:hypothetical protein BDZ94DRAFT_1371110 [Collybia nuda]|uniref:DUF6533 domain-containing protein n=1 Tax=Collybia nuda TaxID=64659 RepID=A0A9P6CDC2_9AGAR|nr:hypothetical protein BDZ94DRAFT_1371110 [Collybia nuda]